MLRSVPMRLGTPRLPIWIALCAIAAAALVLPQVWASRFVTEFRAAVHLHKAQSRLTSRDFVQGRAELRAALRLRPDDAEARRQLAAMELGLGNWELAFLELESLTELHSEDPDGWIRLAELMGRRGWLEAPEAALDKALEAAPQRADAHAMRAEFRFRLGRYYGALIDAQAAIAGAAEGSENARSARRTMARVALRAGGQPVAGEDLDGPPPAAPRRLRAEDQIDVGNLGAWTRERWPGRLGETRQALEAQLQKQSWTEAQRIVDSARTEYPDSAFAPYLAGILELARGNAQEAERQLSAALADAPRSPTVVAALARTWARKEDAAYAAVKLMRLAERDGSFALARYLAARAWVEARDPGHAEGALRRGLDLQPDDPVVYQHLADYYFGLDRAPEALGICQQGLERFPHDLALRMMLAQINAALGRTEEAARAYRAVLSARPDLDIVEYRLAMLLASQDQDAALWQRAVRILDHLQGDRPSDPLLQDVLGWVRYRAGDVRRAGELLESAVKSAPEEPVLHFHLAAVYAGERRTDLARNELNAALASQRPFPQRLEALRLLRANGPAPARNANASARPAEK